MAWSLRRLGHLAVVCQVDAVQFVTCDAVRGLVFTDHQCVTVKVVFLVEETRADQVICQRSGCGVGTDAVYVCSGSRTYVWQV